jgi:hypothetical protein
MRTEPDTSYFGLFAAKLSSRPAKPAASNPAEPTGSGPTEPTGSGPTEPTGSGPTEPTGSGPTEPTGQRGSRTNRQQAPQNPVAGQNQQVFSLGKSAYNSLKLRNCKGLRKRVF